MQIQVPCVDRGHTDGRNVLRIVGIIQNFNIYKQAKNLNSLSFIPVTSP